MFQGNGDGYFVAYDATNGEELWKVNTTHPPLQLPITYAIDGEQYVAIQVIPAAPVLTDGTAMPVPPINGAISAVCWFVERWWLD